ncbi:MULTISPECIES: hypothetical protein [unclassified Sphingomonas]|uniref:hypothetical protein n=1 Tax=unclassified Sphingomonas TaxID=196159 RepID=UPI000DB739D2|nr:hypothetical protein [Sphingomonas sp. 3P27F8]PZU58174.1 MAG: hypothetical protein DI547_10470 [Sphingobium sp.]
MAYKDEKIVTIIMEQLGSVEERCPGYRDEVQQALAEILQAERQHQFARTNIVSKIGDLVGRVGTFLDRDTLPSEG